MPRIPLKWDKETFIKDIVTPIRNGERMVDIATKLGIGRARLYQVLYKYGFNSKKEVLEHTTYK